jgi:nucleoside-diphosphate-sugar epimerase
VIALTSFWHDLTVPQSSNFHKSAPDDLVYPQGSRSDGSPWMRLAGAEMMEKRILNMSARRVLVTGGAGFLGSHLCDRLVEAGHEVLCVDNYFTGRRGNVAHLLERPNFELVRHDVTFPLYVEVDEIYNLACPASPVHYQYDPVQTTKTSVHGAINMLGLAKRTNAKIFQASRCAASGQPLELPELPPRALQWRRPQGAQCSCRALHTATK